MVLARKIWLNPPSELAPFTGLGDGPESQGSVEPRQGFNPLSSEADEKFAPGFEHVQEKSGFWGRFICSVPPPPYSGVTQTQNTLADPVGYVLRRHA